MKKRSQNEILLRFEKQRPIDGLDMPQLLRATPREERTGTQVVLEHATSTKTRKKIRTLLFSYHFCLLYFFFLLYSSFLLL